MSNQSQYPRPNGSSGGHIPVNRIPGTIGSPQHLAQFTAATATGYHPRPQMNPSTYTSLPSSTSNNTSNQGKPPQQMSEFALSAYEAAANAANDSNASKLFRPPTAEPIDLATFKDFKFVTLDGLQIETREVYDEISGTFQWEMCESQEDRCINYIRDQCGNKRVFLVSSGSLGKKVVPEIHNLPQLYAIYIYCSDVKFHQEWTKNYPKVRVVCNDDDKVLLPQLAIDVAQSNIDWGNALLKQNKGDKAKEKFQKALDNLKKYEKLSDPAMVNQVKSKLAECK